MEFVPAA